MDDATRADSALPATRRRRIGRRRVLIAAAALLISAAAAWLAGTALLARAQLTDARASLVQLRADIDDKDFGAAKQSAQLLSEHTHKAHRLTTGPVWWATSAVPVVGAPVRTIRVAADAVDQIAQIALPAVVSVSASLNPHTLRTPDGINLAALSASAPSIHRAALVSSRAEATLTRLPSRTWLGSVDNARTSLLAQLTPINATLGGVDRAAQLIPPMLGASGTRRYFVAFENEAESRGLGGLPGAFAILTATNGKASFSYFGNDSAFDDVPSSVTLAADYMHKWQQSAPTKTYINSDIGPSMADAGQIWASMWQHKTGQYIDGAVAIDPTALSYLLDASGSAHLADGEQVSAGNVVALTQQTVYARYADNKSRKAFLLDIARSVDRQLLSSSNSAGLVAAALTAAGQNRLRIWSNHPTEEAKLEQTSFAQVPWRAGHAVAGFTVVNAAGSKLDYYLDRSVKYARSACGGDLATVESSITLLNRAPTSGLPPYVTTRLDRDGKTAKPGSNRLLVTYYGTPGGQAQSISVNGIPTASTVSTEGGLLAVTVDIEVPVGAPQTVAIRVTEPDATSAVNFIQQPLVQPATLKATGSRADCH